MTRAFHPRSIGLGALPGLLPTSVQGGLRRAGIPERPGKHARSTGWRVHAQVASSSDEAASSGAEATSISDSNGHTRNGSTLGPEEMSKFVRFMHLASPYVMGHRGRTFVIAIPGEVVMRKDRLALLLDDIALLHGLGARLVLVCGAKPQIDDYLRSHGQPPVHVGAYRVTDALALKGALKVAGATCNEISAHLSKAPSIPMVRRHARGEGQMHFAPTVQIVNGNYVIAKRRGIVNGVDFGLMGQVRYVQSGAIAQQLQAGNIVLLTNVGVSAAGELLNCNIYDVATHAAVELRADKMLCLTCDDVRELRLPHYLPLDDAEQLITSSVCLFGDDDCVQASLDNLDHCKILPNGMPKPQAPLLATHSSSNGSGSESGSVSSNGGGGGSFNGSLTTSAPSSSSSMSLELNLDLDSWQQIGYPSAVLAAVVACKNGVKRAHLIDADKDGAILLELYTRDGITGVCMIAADLYEGIRPAQLGDQAEVASLLALMRDSGYDLPFQLTNLANHMDTITVLEREGKVLGCACYADLGTAPDGIRVGEITAIIMSPSYRRQGLGDALLDYVEQELRQRGFRRIALVVEAGSCEFFIQRDFELVGEAATSELLPLDRRRALPAGRGAAAQLYVKPILELDASVDAPAGKRIGF